MNAHTGSESSVEQFYRFSRRNMISLFGLVLLLGATGLALVFSPAGSVARSSARVGWLLPVFIAIVVGLQQSARGRKWRPDAAEVKVALEDEWRVTIMGKASRTAMIVVLLAQWPLALFFAFIADLPTDRTAMGMAIASITLGLLTLIGTFLYLDRE